MKKIYLPLLLGIVAFATGCPNQPSKSFNNKDTFASNVNEYLEVQQGRYNCAVDEGKNYVPARGRGKGREAGTGQCGNTTLTNPLDVAQRVRNDAIEDAITVIDSNYTDFINKIDTRRSKIDFIADVIDLGAGAATGIAKGERPNQILGIALTAFRGGRQSSELNFYKRQTTPILISKMDGNRAKVYAGILQKKSKGVNVYSMKEAIRDLVAYYNAGTLIRAFAELSKDTAAQAQEAERQVQVLRGLDINPIPTVKQENLSDAYFKEQLTLIGELGNIPKLKAEDQPAATAKLKTKLETIWRNIAAKQQFQPFIEKMRQDADSNFKPTLDKVKDNNFATVTAEELLTLIVGFGATVSDKPDDVQAFEDFIKILQSANQ